MEGDFSKDILSKKVVSEERKVIFVWQNYYLDLLTVHP